MRMSHQSSGRNGFDGASGVQPATMPHTISGGGHLVPKASNSRNMTPLSVQPLAPTTIPSPHHGHSAISTSASCGPLSLPHYTATQLKPFTIQAVRTYLHLPPVFVTVKASGSGGKHPTPCKNHNQQSISGNTGNNGGVSTLSSWSPDDITSLLLSSEVVLQDKERVTGEYLDEIEKIWGPCSKKYPNCSWLTLFTRISVNLRRSNN